MVRMYIFTTFRQHYFADWEKSFQHHLVNWTKSVDIRKICVVKSSDWECSRVWYKEDLYCLAIKFSSYSKAGITLFFLIAKTHLNILLHAFLLTCTVSVLILFVLLLLKENLCKYPSFWELFEWPLEMLQFFHAWESVVYR